jgi:hypothetical protein
MSKIQLLIIIYFFCAFEWIGIGRPLEEVSDSDEEAAYSPHSPPLGWNTFVDFSSILVYTLYAMNFKSKIACNGIV